MSGSVSVEIEGLSESIWCKDLLRINLNAAMAFEFVLNYDQILQDFFRKKFKKSLKPILSTHYVPYSWKPITIHFKWTTFYHTEIKNRRNEIALQAKKRAIKFITGRLKHKQSSELSNKASSMPQWKHKIFVLCTDCSCYNSCFFVNIDFVFVQIFFSAYELLTIVIGWNFSIIRCLHHQNSNQSYCSNSSK